MKQGNIYVCQKKFTDIAVEKGDRIYISEQLSQTRFAYENLRTGRKSTMHCPCNLENALELESFLESNYEVY